MVDEDGEYSEITEEYIIKNKKLYLMDDEEIYGISYKSLFCIANIINNYKIRFNETFTGDDECSDLICKSARNYRIMEIAFMCIGYIGFIAVLLAKMKDDKKYKLSIDDVVPVAPQTNYANYQQQTNYANNYHQPQQPTNYSNNYQSQQQANYANNYQSQQNNYSNYHQQQMQFQPSFEDIMPHTKESSEDEFSKFFDDFD